MARKFDRSRPMQKTWGGVTGTQDSLTATQALLWGTGFTVSSVSTLLRLRGSYIIKGTPDAVVDDVVVGIGIGIVSTDAAAVGGVSVPSPLGDPDWSWVWHQYVALAAGQTALLGQDIGSVVRGEIDSKAMRKMKPNESLVIVGQLSTSDYASVIINGGLRVLFGEF